jgi:hypothetical protein
MAQDTFTQENYRQLCDAIATGALEVQFADRKVTYRSLNEMLKIKSVMEKSLGLNKKSTNLYPVCSKGL